MMDNSITYTNNSGESVEMRVDGKWHYGETDLHDYEWAYDTVNDRVSGFRQEPRDFSLRVMMAGGSVDERNRAVDVFEADVRSGTPGTLRVGASEMRCWVTGSSKDGWWYSEGTMGATLTIHADDPVWRREETVQVFRVADGGGSGFLDYPHGDPYDYKQDDRLSEVRSPFRGRCGFRMVVYGPAENPYVIIGGNRYQGDASLSAGDLLIIDSVERTIVLRGATGSESSVFASGVREEGANVFADMPEGTAPVLWSGAFGFDITYIEERSEPVWI